MARSWSVIFASALTTTTGLSVRRSRTIVATRSMARASCTEVPPNFITIMAALPAAGSIEISLRFEQFAVQNGCTGRTADSVVGEHGESPVEYVAGSQPPNHGRHAASTVSIKPRLRPVRSRIVVDGLLRCRRQIELLRRAAEFIPRANDLFSAGRFAELHRDRFGVTVFHRNAIAVCAQNGLG